MDSDDAIIALQNIVDQLVGCESSRTLLERLRSMLDALSALPADLYLADGEAGVYYPVFAFGADIKEAEVKIDEVVSGNGVQLLHHHDEPVGMLVSQGPRKDDSQLSLVATVLGPALMAVQHQEGLVAELRLLHEQMGHLVKAGELLQVFDLEILLVQVLQTALRAVGAQVGAVLTPGDDQALTTRVTWGLRDDHVAAMRLSDGSALADYVHSSGKVLRVTQDQVAELLDLSDLDAAVTGLLALPLVTDKRAQGVLILANPGDDFTPESQRLAETVAGMAALAIDNAALVEGMVERERLGRELAIARKIQANMFPESELELSGFRIDGVVRSCDETGGDYYTYFEHNDRIVAMVADVTGHGLGAALFTTVAHAIIQQQLHTDSGLYDALSVLNQGLAFAANGRFLTAFLASVDPKTGLCTYYSAGHNPVLWLHQGEVRWIESIGMPLGILPNYLDMGKEEQITLDPGDLLVLYTDGFIEAPNSDGVCYGEPRFAELVKRCHADGMSNQALMDELFADIERWTDGAPPEDDLTLVLVDRRA